MKESASGQGVRRIASVLKALGQAPREGLRLSDVAVKTDLNKATVHRLLGALSQVGFVEQDPSTNRFHIGFELFVLGSATASRFGLEEIARPHLNRLESRTNDTVYLSVLSGTDAVCVARHVGSYPVKVLTLNVGDRRPLGIGGGALAILAFLGDEEIERAISANRQRLAAYSNVDVPKLYSLIESTRRQGYAFFDGLVVPEMASLALPIRLEDGRVVAALAIQAIRDRLQGERRGSLIDLVTAEARALEARLAPLAPMLKAYNAGDAAYPAGRAL